MNDLWQPVESRDGLLLQMLFAKAHRASITNGPCTGGSKIKVGGSRAATETSGFRTGRCGVLGNESIELCQQRTIALPGIVRQFLPIERQVVEERLHALLV
jgi:hypothetical protein